MKRSGSLLLVMLLLFAGCQARKRGISSRSGGYHAPDSTIALDGCPDNILHHEGRLYVTSFDDRKLWVIDAATGKELSRFEDFDHYTATVNDMDDKGRITGTRDEQRRARPGSIAIAGDKLFIEQVFCNSLLVFNAGTLHLIDRVKVKDSGEMAPSPDGRKLYFACLGGKEFYIIDVADYQMESVPYPDGARGIGAMIASSDGRLLYLGISRGAKEAKADPPPIRAGPHNPLERLYSGPLLAVYDLSKRRYVAIKCIGDTLMARGDDSSDVASFAFGGDGRTLYIGMSQCMAGVHVFDTVTNSLKAPITCASVHEHFVWPSCRALAFSDGRLYVVVGNRYELAVLDARTRRRLVTVPLGGYGGHPPSTLALSAARAFVAHRTLRRIFVIEL